MLRRTLLAVLPALALVAGLAFAPAASAETSRFTQARFDAAQAAGRAIVVDVHATWCPTCKAQMFVLDRLQTEDKYQDVLILRVDYDTEKDIMRSFNAQQRSTLIAFRGNQETGRLVGQTSDAAIRALLDTAYPGS